MANIKLSSWDTYGNMFFRVDGNFYHGKLQDGAVVARLAEKARNKPGEAFNDAKKYLSHEKSSFAKLPS